LKHFFFSQRKEKQAKEKSGFKTRLWKEPSRFSCLLKNAKSEKEKPRETSVVFFFTDLLGVLRNLPTTPRSFSFRFLFFFQKEKEEL